MRTSRTSPSRTTPGAQWLNEQKLREAIQDIRELKERIRKLEARLPEDDWK